MATEERIAALERHMERMQASFGTHEAGIEEQKKVLLDYIQKEFSTTQLGMMEIAEEARKEFHLQRTQLQSLYEATAFELAGIKAKCDKFESSGQQTKEQSKLIGAKQMIPRVLEKPEDWKTWRSEIEDYCGKKHLRRCEG